MEFTRARGECRVEARVIFDVCGETLMRFFFHE